MNLRIITKNRAADRELRLHLFLNLKSRQPEGQILNGNSSHKTQFPKIVKV